MIALDTNVLVRLLVQDDPKQEKSAIQAVEKAVAQQQKLFIPLIVTVEVIWVLQRKYKRSRQDILTAFKVLRQVAAIEFEHDDLISRLLHEGLQTPAGLSDCLIMMSAEKAGCAGGLTFDKGASSLPFFTLLE